MNGRSIAGVFAAIFIVYAAVLLSYTYPPLVDYPNHMARMYILGNQDAEFISRYYEIDYQVLTNLAMDVLVPIFDTVLPLAIAGKLFLLVTIFLVASGPIFISKVIRGQPTTLSLAGALFALNSAFILGFVNFLFSVGLAMYAFGLYIHLERKRPNLATLIGAIMAVLIFAAHIYGFVTYAVCIGAYYCVRCGPMQPLRLLRHAAQFVPSAFLLALFVMQSLAIPDVPQIESEAPPAIEMVVDAPDVSVRDAGSFVPYKIQTAWKKVVRPFSQYRGFMPFLLVFFLVVAGLYAKARKWPVELVYAAPIFLLYGFTLFLPYELFGAHNVNWRYSIPAILLACGVFVDPVRTRVGHYVLAAAIVSLSMMQVIEVNKRFKKSDVHQQYIISLLGDLPAGAKVFPVFPSGSWGKVQHPVPYLHMASLGVIERQIYIPTLFAFSAQQPLKYQPGYAGMPLKVVYEDFVGLDWSLVEPNFDYVLILDHDGTVDGSAADWRQKIPFETDVLNEESPNVALLSIRH